MWEICFRLVYRAIEFMSDDMQKLMHTYLIPYLWLLKKIYNMHYISHVKLFRLIKEENNLMKSSFKERREHFVNLQIKNGETSNYKHGLFCTQSCFCSVSSLTTVTGILIRLESFLVKPFFLALSAIFRQDEHLLIGELWLTEWVWPRFQTWPEAPLAPVIGISSQQKLNYTSGKAFTAQKTSTDSKLHPKKDTVIYKNLLPQNAKCTMRLSLHTYLG